MLTPLSTDLQLPLSIDEGDNIAIPQGKLANTEIPMDEIRILHLDPFIIGHAQSKWHPSSVFIYLDLYSLLCFVLHSVLTCVRQERANEQYRS